MRTFSPRTPLLTAICFLLLPSGSLADGLEGLDIGFVTQRSALFQSPDDSSSQVCPIQRGSTVVLTSHDPVGKWLNVIDIPSGRQGWARLGFVKIRYAKIPNREVTLDAVVTPGATNPVITIINQLDCRLYFHLDCVSEFAVEPSTVRRIEVPAGVHSFNVAGPNLVPRFGHRALIAGEVYDWRWFSPGSGYKAPKDADKKTFAIFNDMQTQVTAAQKDLDDYKKVSDAFKLSYENLRDLVASEGQSIEAQRIALDHADPAAVSAFNALVDKYNVDLTNSHTAQDAFNESVDIFNGKLHLFKEKQASLDALEKKINPQ